MRDDVKKRAETLPDVSVEQTFLSDDNFSNGKSRQFTVRTTEKQRWLVQTSLDRLLRADDGTPPDEHGDDDRSRGDRVDFFHCLFQIEIFRIVQ